MKKAFTLALGVAFGSLIYQLFVFKLSEIDFVRVAFLSVFAFVFFLLFEKFKKNPSSSNADEQR
jgi:hypothetical protein